MKINWFVYVIQIEPSYIKKDKFEIIDALRKRGIVCGNYFAPIHLQPFYRKLFGYKEGDFPITEDISYKTIALPFYNNLTEEDIKYVVKNLKEVILENKNV